ncbi:MAG: hypothetical protein DRH26_02980 [Deltaproteobacteria bacterium]|nr:MAG: hypothetical protein DRH26_02980 [Deltaproteobacteria bacterium]
MLQVGMGVVLIFLAFLLEMVIIEPSGIYSYSHYGYKQFKIGLSREGLLREINRVIAIRHILTCDSSGPSADLKLTSRRSFEMTEDLTRSHVWICQGKKKVGFLFQFQGDRLARVLRLKVRFFEEGSFPLFYQCQPGIYQDMDGYLNTQTVHGVFYGDETRQSE